MKLRGYLTCELIRRLNRDVPRAETLTLLNALGIATDEPGPAPGFETLGEAYDGACQTGSFILQGTLDFIGHADPVHLRISYAGPADDSEPWDMIAGPAMMVDLLTWSEGSPTEPRWVPVGPAILSDSMVEDLWPAISLHACQQDGPGQSRR